MIVIVEMFCPDCSCSNCGNHKDKIQKHDQITGLDFEIRCICNKHSKLNEVVKE